MINQSKTSILNLRELRAILPGQVVDSVSRCFGRCHLAGNRGSVSDTSTRRSRFR